MSNLKIAKGTKVRILGFGENDVYHPSNHSVYSKEGAAMMDVQCVCTSNMHKKENDYYEGHLMPYGMRDVYLVEVKLEVLDDDGYPIKKI